MDRGQQALAAQWIDMAYGHARLWARRRPLLRDEFVSGAMFALVEAARNFDPALNKAFYTYLKWHLRHARKEVLRAHVPKGYRITGCLRFNAEALARRRPALVEWDPRKDGAVGADHPEFADVEMREWVEHHLAHLGDRHANVCVQMYWYGRFAQEVADELGCTRREVLAIHDEALEALRSALAAEGPPRPDSPAAAPGRPMPPRRPAGPAVPSCQLGTVVRALRVARGWSVPELAAESGLEAGQVEAVERNLERPGRPAACRLAEAFGQPSQLFLSLAGHRPGRRSA
jgi:RNA polymerase sigma factor (sigma-70 family)